MRVPLPQPAWHAWRSLRWHVVRRGKPPLLACCHPPGQPPASPVSWLLTLLQRGPTSRTQPFAPPSPPRPTPPAQDYQRKKRWYKREDRMLVGAWAK